MFETQNLLLLAAAAFALLTAFIHLLVGGKYIARPLLASDMHPVARYTNYYCWHMVTIILFVMAACYIWPILAPSDIAIAALATLLAWSFAIWSLGLMISTKSKIADLPQWTLFLAIALPGTARLLL